MRVRLRIGSAVREHLSLLRGLGCRVRISTLSKCSGASPEFRPARLPANSPQILSVRASRTS